MKQIGLNRFVYKRGSNIKWKDEKTVVKRGTFFKIKCDDINLHSQKKKDKHMKDKVN